MSDEGGEKTEEPTQKKIDDTRRKGNVWKSKDLSGVGVFLAGMGCLKALWPMVEKETAALFQYGFVVLADPSKLHDGVFTILWMATKTLFLLTLPVVIGGAVIGAILEFLQVGSLFALDAVMPKFDKLNPINGAKNLFSKK